jgi:hypothetical protein
MAYPTDAVPLADLTPDRLLRRSFRARFWPAHAQVGTGLGCPWLAAGDLGFPPVLARPWHVSLREASWLSDRFCRSWLWSGAVVRLRSWEQQHCQVRVDSCKRLSVCIIGLAMNVSIYRDCDSFSSPLVASGRASSATISSSIGAINSFVTVS